MKKLREFIFHSFQEQPLAVALSLLIVFPPVGILYMFILGAREIIRVLKGKKDIPFDIISVLFLILFISTIGAAIQQQQWSYLSVSLSIVVFYGVYLYSMNQNKMTQMKYFSWVIIFGGVYQYLFGSISLLLFHSGWSNKLFGYLTGSELLGFLSHQRLYGSAYNPNYSAFLLVFAMGFLLAEFLKAVKMKNYRRILLYCALLIFIVAGIIATGSRSGFGVMIILFGIFLFRISWKWMLFLSAFVLANGFWLYRFVPRNYDIMKNFETRIFIWKNSINLVKEYPRFGLTPLGFPAEYLNQTGHHAAHAHNIFLAFFTDFGVLAGVIFAGITAVFMFHFLKLLKYNRSKSIFDWFLFSLPILGLTGILDFPLSSPQIALPAIIIVSKWQQYIVRTNHSFRNRHAALIQENNS
ncbi:O-antigen ligase family protein [Bacillus sp. FJAT-49736]|uniref:O-antigen ligase family protein n=1 Tax=Bacillus sp. FJAT-49736 TaxID=2833582 RepID=UPI001BC9D0E2|nr:O-antigen ligase family protein [Bacillus sp. FJAT-49736]MBS4175566.1 O-antigen ligase family protein [Bacillus sp. FJAT-49736]